MRSLTFSQYGSPDVVQVTETEKPIAKNDEVLVEVHATGVNTGDWRVRAAAFPGVLAIPGRLMFGLLRPRNQRLGTEFAGVVSAVGSEASRFAVGDRVYGFSAKFGASAEYLAIPDSAAIAALPSDLSFVEGAALPFGGLAALAFLTDFGQLKANQRVLVIGASGGVGVYAVQIAKAWGARVTAVAGPSNQDLLTGLGADKAIDYTRADVGAIADRYDVILDCIGALRPQTALKLLRNSGVFLPLNISLREIWASLLNPFRSRKVILAVNDDTAEGLQNLNELIADQKLRPVVDRVYEFDDARAAHAFVERRHRSGAVVLRIRA